MIELRCPGANCTIGSAWEIYLTAVPWNRIGLTLNFPVEKRGVSSFVVLKSVRHPVHKPGQFCRVVVVLNSALSIVKDLG